MLIFSMSFLVPLLRVNTLQSHRPETGRYSYGERGSHKEHFSFMAPWLLHAYLHASQAPLGLPCQKGLRGVSEHWRGGTVGHRAGRHHVTAHIGGHDCHPGLFQTLGLAALTGELSPKTRPADQAPA